MTSQLLRAQTDRRLAGLVRDGHDGAFEAIVERYRRPLLRYLRPLLPEPLVEDVLQATFVLAWEALSDGTEVQDLRPWLYRIAHNEAIDALQSFGAASADAPGVPAASAEVEVERREQLRATVDEIDALPERQRAAILAVAVADRSHADVAAELGISDGALRQLLLRARTRAARQSCRAGLDARGALRARAAPAGRARESRRCGDARGRARRDAWGGRGSEICRAHGARRAAREHAAPGQLVVERARPGEARRARAA